MKTQGRVPSPFLEKMRREIRVRQLSYATEKTYLTWTKRYILYHQKRHPGEMGANEVAEFLTHLAADRRVAKATQNQALNALVFLYRYVVKAPLANIDALRSRKPRNLPVVLTRGEVALVLAGMQGAPKLVASLLYGSGLRLTEALRLRIKDIDSERRIVTVRRGKGDTDRVTLLPESLLPALQEQIQRSRDEYRNASNGDGVSLPAALADKYPNAAKEWPWYWLFPSTKLARDPRSGRTLRHHLSTSAIQKAVRRAVRASGISKRASCHTFRHSFATHLLESGYDIRTIQELLGHRSVKTTMIYTHVLNRGGLPVRSPLDLIPTQSE